jgi:Carboxypeptidase regulatory-like domain
MDGVIIRHRFSVPVVLRGGLAVRFTKTLLLTLVLVLFAAQASFAQDKTTGSVKGKIKVEVGSPGGITVLVRQGEKELRRGVTEKNGDFLITGLTPGIYGFTFRKPGLSIGTIENIEIKAGKTRSLGDRLILTIDEGSIAFIRGSVFMNGRSVPGAEVELAKVQDDGSAKKIDGRLTTETGSFVFRLAPDVAKYRVTLKTKGAEPVSKDVDVDGAAVYRVALSMPPRASKP